MNKEKSKTRWHRLLGNLLKRLLTPTGITVLTDLPVMSEPPEADILLLRRDHKSWTKEQKARLPDGIRDTRAGHVLLEFKYSESINKKVFRQTLCYDYLYGAGQKLKKDEVKTFLISAKTPKETTLKKFAYYPWKKPGIYHSKSTFLEDIPLILLNELSDEPHNAWIKCFASRKKEKMSAFNTLDLMGLSLLDNQLKWIVEGLLFYWFNKGGQDMEMELTPEQVIEYGKKWQHIVLAGIAPDEIMAKYSINERLKGLETKDILQALEPKEILKGLNPKDIEEYLDKLKKSKKEQKS